MPSGILRVPQYHGEIFWNKTRYVKDPSTGKRVSRLNPKEEWQHAEVPELRIVDEDLVVGEWRGSNRHMCAPRAPRPCIRLRPIGRRP